MLYGMTYLMGSYGSGSGVTFVVYRFAKVYGFFGRVIVVGKAAGRADNLYVINTVIVQHFCGYLGTAHTIAQVYLRVMFKFAFQPGAYREAYQSYNTNQNVISYKHVFLVFY
jgi:hypothetical protein